MEGDDVALGEQRVKIRVCNSGNILLCPTVGQNLTAEGLGDGGHPKADGACSDHAELLDLQLKADETVLSPLAPHSLVAGGNVPI